MAIGAIPARGRWRYEEFDTLSTATYRLGSIVKLHGARTVSEYSGGEASLLGIALSNSVDSLPAGKVIVALPGPGCTAFVDVPSGVGASSISVGQAVGFYKSGNTVSTITFSYTSAAGKVAVIEKPIDSALSKIEVSFLANAIALNASAESQTIP